MLQVMPDISWLEADWVQDLEITNNTVDATYGGIFVGLIRPNDMGSGRYLNHANVSILGNTIINASYAPVLVTSAHDLVVGGNTIQNCLCSPPNFGQGMRRAMLYFSCQNPPAKTCSIGWLQLC